MVSSAHLAHRHVLCFCGLPELIEKEERMQQMLMACGFQKIFFLSHQNLLAESAFHIKLPANVSEEKQKITVLDHGNNLVLAEMLCCKMIVWYVLWL